MKRAVFTMICVVASVAAAGCETREKARVSPQAAARAPAEPAAAPAPAPPPALSADGLRDIDGPTLLAEIRASKRKATLLNVWASWCGSCKRELPMLVELGAALERDDVGVLFVSVDTPEARPAAVALLETLDPRPESFIARGALGPFKRAVNPGWKGAIPATALYDANAELLWFWPGPVLEHEIAAIVTQYLAGQPLEGPTLVEPG